MSIMLTGISRSINETRVHVIIQALRSRVRQYKALLKSAAFPEMDLSPKFVSSNAASTATAGQLPDCQRTRVRTWASESYKEQKEIWPGEGKHILAQYDDNTIVVYQAFNHNIADYAVKHQCFGGSDFSYSRMSWIKPNFLWMMYRCGWATKKGQERVLAVRITRRAFEEILDSAWSVNYQKENGLSQDDLLVRLQWDPDHSPTYEKLPRRAIQLGLKGNILKKYGTDWIVSIEDITEFVQEQSQTLARMGEEHILVASERVYSLNNQKIIKQVGLDM